MDRGEFTEDYVDAAARDWMANLTLMSDVVLDAEVHAEVDRTVRKGLWQIVDDVRDLLALCK